MAASGGEVVIELEDVHKSFGSQPVLRGIDLRIRAGETFTILGGSGSGKSVLLKHIIGLLRPERGRVRVLGVDVATRAERDLVDLRTEVSMVFQSAALFDSLSVHENVAYPLREHRRDWSEDRIAERVVRSLESVGLAGVEKKMPSELSGGMRKRVGVARGIALEPKVILYDEPTTGLDPANQRRIGELIAGLQRDLGVTSVVVTHELELCFAISDRVALLRQGRICAQGSAEEMKHSEDEAVRAFLEGARDDAQRDDESPPDAPAGSEPASPGDSAHA